MPKTDLPEFHLEVLDLHGRFSRRTLRARNLSDARTAAAGDQLTVLRCTEAGATTPLRSILRNGIVAPAPFDTVAFSQDLATLMSAGLTVKDAVGTLQRKESSSARGQLLASLSTAMNEGLSFSAALAQTAAFPKLLVATAAASEQTGDLPVGLSRYAAHQASLRSVRDKVIGACVYPLLLLGVGSLVIFVLLGVVVPRFSRLLESSDRELPPLSKALMIWGQFADAHPFVPLALVAAFVAGAACLALQWRQPALRRKWLARAPGVARIAREFQHLQMYRTAAILTARGIPIHRALSFTLDLLHPTDQELLRTALVRMREGLSMSTALAGVGISDPVAESMLGVAERSGALSEMLDRVADFYERALQRNIDITSRLIEPLLMILFGLVIGGIVVMMYLPIFDLAAAVG